MASRRQAVAQQEQRPGTLENRGMASRRQAVAQLEQRPGTLENRGMTSRRQAVAPQEQSPGTLENRGMTSRREVVVAQSPGKRAMTKNRRSRRWTNQGLKILFPRFIRFFEIVIKAKTKHKTKVKNKVKQVLEEQKENVIKKVHQVLEEHKIENEKIEYEEKSHKLNRTRKKWLKDYIPGQQILLVGEGDFSFSSSLARAFHHAHGVFATSLDSSDNLMQKYRQAKFHIKMLKRRGATVLHGVDATKMLSNPDLQNKKFDRIIFNFPHAGFSGSEKSKHVISSHRNLMMGFFKNAKKMLHEDGQVHVRHKCGGPYEKWDIPGLASKFSFELQRSSPFKRWNFPGYDNKRGDGRQCDKNFHFGKCITYKFCLHDPKTSI